MIIEAITSAFILILVTELGDKTMLSTIVLSARYKRPYAVFAAVMLALLTVTLIGIGAGFLLTEIIPTYILVYISGSVFIIFGFYYLLTAKKDEDADSIKGAASFVSIFSLVFIAEFGDKTQLAVISLTITLIAPVEVFVGAILGFLIVNGIAVIIGEKMGQKLPLLLIKRVAAILFIVFGILILAGIL
ncbi:MAG: TMEM165/GDT1 family protein [Candidatus Hodarchaeota archaeon]